jgi:hypothetical protein
VPLLRLLPYYSVFPIPIPYRRPPPIRRNSRSRSGPRLLLFDNRWARTEWEIRRIPLRVCWYALRCC